ncbi:hypothetical protein BT63DRAFT_458724 [Microthyrium microscopicum]|uniref:Glycine zipper 2TM domain-containing protein n=1 Tax=Microthyrium microscopicum TaxID=703497 RepID=A0A6A6U447_9PEZI|nr:hypothetical protein BT63DRAFT_458724 [Microthyrium microscopicum]
MVRASKDYHPAKPASRSLQYTDTLEAGGNCKALKSADDCLFTRTGYLGLEAITHVTDKYHDIIYEKFGKVGPWISEKAVPSRSQSRNPKGSHSRPVSPIEMPSYEEERRHSSRRRSRRDDYDNYSDEDIVIERRRDRSRRRDGSRGSYYAEKDKVEEWARESRHDHNATTPQIKVDTTHIYPPPPLPMSPPYPTTAGPLVAMPPDAPYPLIRAHSDDPRPRETQLLPRGRAPVARARSAIALRQRSRSWSRGSDEERHHHHHRRRAHSRERDGGHKHDSKKFNHVTAGLAGAIAGGFIGKQVSKGDLAATVGAAVVGALGAGLAEKQWERHRDGHRREEKRWEHEWRR